MEDTLQSRTLELLRSTPLTLREVAAGSSVGYHWLAKFKQGRFGEVGAEKLERVHRFLTTAPAQGAEPSRLAG